jgi:hypothetical protein
MPQKGLVQALGLGQFPGYLFPAHAQKMVVPMHVIITMQSQFMARRGHSPQNFSCSRADQRRRQQGTIEHGPESIERRRPGAPHFFQKSLLLKDWKMRPELSGPKDTKKEALIRRAARISKRAGIPCRNPSRVSTSIFNPNRGGKMTPGEGFWEMAVGKPVVSFELRVLDTDTGH